MSDIFTSRQMEGIEPLDQAKKAIKHTLGVIKENRQVAYHLGIGTQAFSLLTEAAATLFGETDLEKCRRYYASAFNYPADSEIVTDIAALARDLIISLDRNKYTSQEFQSSLRADFADAVIKKLKEAGRA